MGSAIVVVILEIGEGCLKFGASHKQFAGPEFVAEFAEEAPDVAVLPGLARLGELV